MLQPQLFLYTDTHRNHLGVNYQSIPVYMPVDAKVNNYQRGGSMMVYANGGGALNNFPNNLLGPMPSADGIWHSDSVSGDILITFPTVFLARRLVPMASGIVFLCRVMFCIVRLETRAFFCNFENSFAVRLTPMLVNA
jgi:hypothetical protein